MAKAKNRKMTLEEALVPVEEQPYEVPGNWCWTFLENLCDYMKAGGDKPSNISEERTSENNIPVVANGIQNDGIMGYTSTPIIDEETITVSGRGTIGYSIYRNYPYYPVVRLIILKPNKWLNPKYLKYIFDYFKEDGTGSSIPQLTVPSIKKKNIPLPPLAEQQRIVERIEGLFSKLDEVNDRIQMVIDSKEVFVTALLYRAFEGVLTQSWREEKNLSYDWTDTNIGELFSQSTGKALKKGNTEGLLHKYITTSNLYWGRFDFSEVREMYYKETELEKCTATNGDLLICNGGDVGRAAIWNFDYDICLQNHVSRLRKKSDNIDVRFFYYYFMLAKRKGEITGTGIGISSLSAKSIAAMKVKLPSKEEQTEISNMLDDLLSKENNTYLMLENTVTQTDTMKKSIMAKAFRGELGTNHPEEESSVELLKQILKTD